MLLWRRNSACGQQLQLLPSDSRLPFLTASPGDFALVSPHDHIKPSSYNNSLNIYLLLILFLSLTFDCYSIHGAEEQYNVLWHTETINVLID